MRAVFGEVTLTDVQIDPEFEARLRAPLLPVWQVVHREVLLALLDHHLDWLEEHGGEVGDYDRAEQLRDRVAAGTLGVLTKERWEGTE